VRAEPVVLVIAAEVLIVQVDVEQLARIPCLRHAVHEVEPCHVLVGHLRIHAHHLRVIQRRNEAQHVACGGQVDVSPRFVGLGLQRELQIIALVDRILTHEIQRLAEALACVERALARIALDPFAAAPKYVDPRAELHAQVDRSQRLVQRIGAHLGVVGRECTVFEGGITEEIGGGHRHDQSGVDQGLLEVCNDAIALRRGGVDRHQVIVMEVDAVSARFGQQVNDLDGRELSAHLTAERI